MTTEAGTAPFDGFRVLVVEDEAIVAMLIETYLVDIGCLVAGPSGTVREALQRIDGGPDIDAAILDMNLAGERVDPVAVALTAKRVPFLFLTGYGNQPVEAYPDSPVLGKPFEAEELYQALDRIRARGVT